MAHRNVEETSRKQAYASVANMDDRRYTELLNAILDLRSATEMGFVNVHQRFDAQEARSQNNIDAMEERWERRFSALETRVEDGFRNMDRRFGALEARMDAGFRDVDRRFGEVAVALGGIRSRLSAVEQR